MNDRKQFADFLNEALSRRGLETVMDYVVFGSSVMRLHGLRDQVSDVDLFVTAPRFAMLRRHPEWVELRPRDDDPPLLETNYQGVDFHAFYAWTSRDHWICAPEAFIQRGLVHSLPCIPLSMVAFHKQACLDIVRELPCSSCKGDGYLWDQWGTVRKIVCRLCEGSGRFRVAGSRFEKHERDLQILSEHIDLPTAIVEQAFAHGARPGLELAA